MARKKLIKNRLKDLKKKPEKQKRIQLKHNPSDVSNLFDLSKTLYYSGFALTDNRNTILFSIDNNFLEKNNLTNELKEFNLNEDDLQIKFDRQQELKPFLSIDDYTFDEIGSIKKETLDWFVQHYPKCILHKVTEWFGKSVNTLIIVLNNRQGKPVGVVKTYN
jgi:hypothetical protein